MRRSGCLAQQKFRPRQLRLYITLVSESGTITAISESDIFLMMFFAFSSNTSFSYYKAEGEKKKLPIKAMNGYNNIDQAFAEQRGLPYRDKYVRGLPFGLRLSNDIVFNQDTEM